MLRTLYALVLVSNSLAVAGLAGYDFGIDVAHLHRRHDVATPIVVERLPLAFDGSIPLRLEIRQLSMDQHRWDLYILALSMMQTADQADPLSWYQIAGIHGVPFQPWNGVLPAAGAAESGYCTHNSVLFPLWHRPYMALFEQQMFRLVNAIASMFANVAERQLYQRAAADFRVPYWDWSRSAPAGETHLPIVFWNPVVMQNGPNGVQTISNPLYSYQFHPLDSEAFIWNPLKQWNETKRGPETAISLTAPPSNNEKVNAALLSKLPEIQQRLYVLFSNYHDFNSFSNKAWAVSQGLSALDSIESVHDMIHLYGGSKGHLTYVPLSSFDPLFFLHHGMTDRLIAMWQVLNPSAWITPMAAGETTFTAVKGTMQTADSPLTPFYSSTNGTFWTSNSARTTEAFGYAYADTSPGDVRLALIGKINDWYGPSRGNEANVLVSSSSGRYTEWLANVHVEAGSVQGPLTVHLFLGEAPSDKSAWETAANRAGSVGVLAAMGQTTAKISGAVPLTSALRRSKAPDQLGPAAVTPWLRGRLQFRILGVDDQELDPRHVGGLYVAISSAEVEVTDELPRWGPATTRLELWP
ncbi:tyrosinase precursor [Ophiocordyceps camponoti-floridani]|uniref:Tyrosinase n=1 Tax=Ophiocordyceps camponoti-floridani TaxID=2030778 RepID=A0A8H4Q371_9HYPO|nr:tyrosinase precursor [Ophiocordyceps camponoti-floridani]